MSYFLLTFAATKPMLAITPNQTLQIMWVPDKDASLSPITYIVNVIVKKGTEKAVSKLIHYPITTVTLPGLPHCSTGTVTLQAENSGALSETISATFRMVNITGNGG